MQSKYADNNEYLSRKIITLSKYDLYAKDKINKLISQSYMNLSSSNFSQGYIYGWGLLSRYSIGTYDTALALEAIEKANYKIEKYLGAYYQLKNRASLKSNNNHWGWVAGQEDSIYVSSKIYKTINANVGAYAWITNSQNQNGSFGNGLLDTIGVVLYLELDETKLNKALQYIVSSQNITGHWDNDPYFTSLCLETLYSKGMK